MELKNYSEIVELIDIRENTKKVQNELTKTNMKYLIRLNLLKKGIDIDSTSTKILSKEEIAKKRDELKKEYKEKLLEIDNDLVSAQNGLYEKRPKKKRSKKMTNL